MPAFEEREGCLLNFRTPVLELFSETGEKSNLYYMCQSFTYELSKGTKRILIAGGFWVRDFP